MIETAIYSWKSKDLDAMPWSHACLWMQSVTWAKQWFPNVVLFSDVSGIEFLRDKLDLPFTESRALPELPDELAHVYELPKLCAMQEMAKAGVSTLHIDFDAFLRKAPGGEILTAPFAAEYRYTLKPFVMEINARLPHRRFQVAPMHGLAGGIQGGTDCERIYATATTSIDTALDHKNRPALKAENGYQASVMIGEAAWSDAFPEAAQLLPRGTASRGDYYSRGYVHLAGLKLDRGALAQAELMAMHDWPEKYRSTRQRFDA